MEEVGTDNFLLHIKATTTSECAAKALDYQPGHVLALEIQPPPPPPSDDSTISTTTTNDTRFSERNEKTEKDLKANDGWLRGPYTVSRCCSTSNNNSLEILIKRVGYKSNVLATASANTPVKFGGKFKVPIADGILNNLELEDPSTTTTQRVVMISTGVGIGPCVGAAEVLLGESEDRFDGPIELITSFRTTDEVAMKEDLEKLAKQHPTRFHWKPIITSQEGRLSDSADKLISLLKPPQVEEDTVLYNSISNTHYHIIGNGQMVNEWKAGLEQAGVPAERVTVEAYFNHMGSARDEAVKNIATAVETSALHAAME